MSTAISNGYQSRDLREGYADFILSRRAMRCTPATLKFYETTTGRFVVWLIDRGVDRTDAIEPMHVRAFLAEFFDLGARSSYVHGHARAIRTFLRFLHQEGCTPQLVKFEMPVLSQEPLAVLSDAEVISLVKACRDPRDRAVVLLLVDTGLRRSEACALKWGDVDIDSGVVRVARGKGGNTRSVVIGIQTRRALLKYRKAVQHGPEDPLIQTQSGRRLTGRGLRSLLLRLSAKAELKVSPHALRRTFATLSLRAGMSPLHLQGLLGHSTLEMTRRYVRMVDEDLRIAHRDHGPIDTFLR